MGSLLKIYTSLVRDSSSQICYMNEVVKIMDNIKLVYSKIVMKKSEGRHKRRRKNDKSRLQEFQEQLKRPGESATGEVRDV